MSSRATWPPALPPLGVHFTSGETGQPRITYGDPPTPYRPLTQIDTCAAWLLDTLENAGGPVRPRDLLPRAAAAGFKEWVVFEARRRLERRIVDTQGKRSPHNRWRLASHPRPAPDP